MISGIFEDGMISAKPKILFCSLKSNNPAKSSISPISIKMLKRSHCTKLHFYWLGFWKQSIREKGLCYLLLLVCTLACGVLGELLMRSHPTGHAALVIKVCWHYSDNPLRSQVLLFRWKMLLECALPPFASFPAVFRRRCVYCCACRLLCIVCTSLFHRVFLFLTLNCTRQDIHLGSGQTCFDKFFLFLQYS